MTRPNKQAGTNIDDLQARRNLIDEAHVGIIRDKNYLKWLEWLYDHAQARVDSTGDAATQVQHQVDLDHKQGPTLEEVLMTISGNVPFWWNWQEIERKLTALFAKYPKAEAEAVKAENVKWEKLIEWLSQWNSWKDNMNPGGVIIMIKRIREGKP